MRGSFLKKLSRIIVNKRKVILIAMPFVFVLFCFALVPRPAHANILGDAAGWVSDNVVDAGMKWLLDRVSELLLSISNAFYALAWYLVKMMIELTMAFAENQSVATNWAKVRDLSLQLMGIALLAIAFMNIMKIKVESWGIQKMIPQLLLVSFLIIFSRFICISVVNFGDALAHTFQVQLAGDNLYQGFDKIATTFGQTDTPNLISACGVFILTMLCALVLLILAIILLVRMVVIVLMIVISPLAFLMYALPITQTYHKQWWTMFIKWVFYYPITIFILCVGLSFSNQVKIFDFTGMFDDGNVNNLVRAFGDFFVSFIVMILALILPLKLLGAIGKTIQGMATGKTGIPGMKVDTKTVRDYLGNRSKGIQERKLQSFSGGMRKAFGNDRIGKFVQGKDSIGQDADNATRAKMVSEGKMNEKQLNMLAQGMTIDQIINAKVPISDGQKDWYKSFQSRGGTRDDIIRSLDRDGHIDNDSKKNSHIQALIKEEGDWNGSMKNSKKHQARLDDDGQLLPLHKIADFQRQEMSPGSINEFTMDQLNEFANPANINALGASTRDSLQNKKAFMQVLNKRAGEAAAAMTASNKAGDKQMEAQMKEIAERFQKSAEDLRTHPKVDMKSYELHPGNSDKP